MANVPPSVNPQQAGASQVVLVFLSSLAAPVALYAESPLTLFEEIKRIMQQAQVSAPKLIEKTGMGPLKKVAFLDINVIGVALQNEMRG
jgi:hypothetical protein